MTRHAPRSSRAERVEDAESRAHRRSPRTITLSTLLLGGGEAPPPEDFARAFEDLEAGHDRVAVAGRLADVTQCVGALPSDAAAEPVPWAPDAYALLAAEANAALHELRAAVVSTDAFTRLQGELAIVARVRAELERRTDAPLELARVVELLAAIESILDDALAAPDAATAEARARTAAFAYLDLATAAAALRAAVGLPAMATDDAL